MRWVLCALLFALAVALAIGTVAIRAENIRLRHRLELDFRQLEARRVELHRLSVQAVESVTPERLAASLRALLRAPRPVAAEGAPWQ
jgi:uncharacterized membrane-anchored protein YhcB (DUF1043 family)